MNLHKSQTKPKLKQFFCFHLHVFELSRPPLKVLVGALGLAVGDYHLDPGQKKNSLKHFRILEKSNNLQSYIPENL